MTAAAAPESGLNQTIDFMADRFLAVVAKLAEAEAAVQRVRALCDEAERVSMGGVGPSLISARNIRAALAGAE